MVLILKLEFCQVLGYEIGENDFLFATGSTTLAAWLPVFLLMAGTAYQIFSAFPSSTHLLQLRL